MNALWLPSSTIDSEKSTVTGIAVCITRGPEITGVTTLLQLLPQPVMSCPVPPSVCYISFLYWAFTHQGIFMNTPVHCSLYLCRSKYPYIPSLDSESMGLGMPWLIIQAKNLCKANPPPPTKRPASLRICQGVLAS